MENISTNVTPLVESPVVTDITLIKMISEQYRKILDNIYKITEKVEKIESDIDCMRDDIIEIASDISYYR